MLGLSDMARYKERWQRRDSDVLVLKNVRIVNWDTESDADDIPACDIYVRGGRIRYIFAAGSTPTLPDGFMVPRQNSESDPLTTYVNCHNRFICPGLCDAHVHCTADSANLPSQLSKPESLVTARAVVALNHMLRRGFTTIRDCGGADWGLAEAIEEGTIAGPRLLFTGHALSATGGHGDMRSRGRECFACGASLRGIGRVADGVAEVRKATRDELRKGAHCIKVMASGGVSSPTDRLTNCQFSLEELSAIVDEAAMAKTYVAAHAYMPDAIQRAVESGVRSIEHGNYIDEYTANMLATKSTYLVPTIIIYKALRESGVEAGMEEELVRKVQDLVEAGRRSLQIAHQAGIKICYGSDLLGSLQDQQLKGLMLMSDLLAEDNEGLSSEQVFRSATANCAELFQMQDQIGRMEEGFLADCLVLDKDPRTAEGLEELANGKGIAVIVKEGVIVENQLG